MTDLPTFEPAVPGDWPDVSALLIQSGLPLEGAQAHLANFIVARRAGDRALAGVAGYERFGDVALLRSVAVAEPRHGLGAALVRRILAQARQAGVRRMVLLTNTAEGFFPRFGFHRIERAEAPEAVRASEEFRGACPETATTMLLELA